MSDSRPQVLAGSGSVLAFSALVFFVVCPAVSAIDAEELFARGNQSYDSAQYLDAIAAYNEILDSGLESAALYYNLGNAYFESEDLGHAALNYLRAQRLDPSDEDIRDNLKFARAFVTVQMEGVRLNPISDMLESFTGGWSLGRWGWLSTIALAAFCLATIAHIFSFAPPRLMRLTIAGFGSVFLCLVLLTTFKYQSEFSADRAVVVLPDLPVSDKPATDGDLEFIASAGLEVEILGSSNGYYLVLFENKRRGWLRAAAVERL